MCADGIVLRKKAQDNKLTQNKPLLQKSHPKTKIFIYWASNKAFIPYIKIKT